MSLSGRSLLLAFWIFTAIHSAQLFGRDPEPLRSGLRPGDKTRAFYVQDVTGPHQGRSLCYACAFGKHAVVNIQTRELSRELIGVIQKLDAIVDSPASIKGDSKHAFVVYITDDPDSAVKELRKIAQRYKIKNVPLTIFDELTGPRGYKLAPEAEVTVMMWKDTVVAVNHAAESSELSAAQAGRVLKDIRKHLAR